MSHNISIKAKNFVCFGNNPQGFDAVYPINVIIGKNNSGKSALLKLIRYITSFHPPLNTLGHNKSNPTVYIEQEITKEMIDGVFSPTSSGGYIPGNSHFEYGSRLVGNKIIFHLEDGNHRLFSIKENPDLMKEVSNENERVRLAESMIKKIVIPYQGKEYRFISAERDINKEPLNTITHNDQVLDGSGRGATNLIANFLNNKMLPESRVENELLNALSEIYGEDATFSRIQAQMDPSTKEYEIFLEEKKKGERISLSDSGSSLKTILLVLINIILIPEFYKKNTSNYIFAFEELENNLHPSLQRRLLLYLLKIVQRYNCTFFLTTHSNIFIDVFSHQENSQILHIKHDGEKAVVENVRTHIEKCNILDDLDFRASDVLQANGVLWVEGPTDRIYLKKWIDLWSNGELKEDIHYQFVFYGGSVRKHLSASSPDTVNSAISVFRINRNAIIVMDSDKNNQRQKLENSKQKLIDELKDSDTSMTFVTKGKDIENYINPKLIKEYFNLQKEPLKISQFQEFSEYLNKIKKGSGNSFERNKMLFADSVKDLFNKNDLSKMYDIDKQLRKIVSLIKKWNRLDK